MRKKSPTSVCRLSMSLTTKMEHVVLAYNLPRGPAVDRGKVAEAAHAEAEAALAAQPSMGALRVNNSASDPSRLIFREHLGSRAGFLNPPFKSIHATANLSSALFVGNQGGAIMRTLGKIAVTLGVIGAIAASSTVPAVRLSSSSLLPSSLLRLSSSLLPSSLLCLLGLRSRTLLPLRWGRLLTLKTEL